MIKSCCPKCKWPIKSRQPVAITCPKCGVRFTVGQQTYINPWLPLHQYAFTHADNWDSAKAEKWYLYSWLPTVPRFTPEGASCGCETHWAELTKQHPPDFSSPKAFFDWGVHRHNDVSRDHSHKPEITLEEAYRIYWQGIKQ